MTRLFFLVTVFFAALMFVLLGIMPASAQPQLQEPHQEDEPTATPQSPVALPPPDESQQEGQAQDTPEPAIDWANLQMESEGGDPFPQVVEPIPPGPAAPESPALAPAPAASGGESSPPPSDGGPAPATEGITHVVQAGETLYRIAKRYGISVTQLMAANNIQNPRRLQAGQVLIIPGLVSNVDFPVATPQEGAVQPGESYVVQRGDSLFEIARRFGVSVQALIAANGLANPDRIDAGQSLTIPRGGSAPVVAATPVLTIVAEMPATPPESADFYVVRRGDNLSRIAQRYGVSVQALIAANNLVRPDRIDAGQSLIIPHAGDAPRAPETPVPAVPTEAPATPALATGPEEPATPGSAGLYVVQRGDSFYRIARRYGVSAQALAEANNLTIDDRIDPGQTLIIPGGTANRSLEHSAAVQPEALLISVVAQGITEGTNGPAASSSLFIWPIPLEDGWIPKWYRADHPGIDIILPTGTPIQAAASGTIEFSGWNNYGFGNLVVITHDNGYRTLYAHQSERLVEKGDTVVQGQVIGLVGISGRATDPHLHFEIRQPYTPVNPCFYLPGGCQ